MIQNLFHGLTALGNGPSIAYLIAGALIGTLVGVIPGLSTAIVLSILLVFIYHVDLTGALCLFLGAHAGSYYSASVTSILLNTPAHPEAFAVTFDGFPMAQRGEPGRALGISAASTCIGGLVGCLVLIGFLQVIDDLPGVFHPPEYVALVALAMLMVGTLGADSVAKAIVASGMGVTLASIGPSPFTGTFRYTFNAIGLEGGISLVAVALGLFAVPQMVMVFGTGTTFANQDMTGKEIAPAQAIDLSSGYGRQLIGGIFESFRHIVVLIQSGVTGALTGLVPGVGGFAANFLSYSIAQKVSKNGDKFGTGVPEGIIGPEGASLSKEAGSMIPILGLGIPGSVGGALFIAALSIKGVRTGYGFTAAYPIVPYEIVWIIALSGIIGTVAGALVGPQLAKVTKVPGPIYVPFILALSVLGAFLAGTLFFAVMEVLAFGIIGLALRRLKFPLAPFILGFVLGPTLETNIYFTHHVYPGFSFIGKRPLADGIFLLAIIILLTKTRQIIRESRKKRTERSAEVAHIDDPVLRAEAIKEQERKRVPYPVLALIVSVLLLGASLYFIIFGLTHYNSTTVTMPVVGAILIGLPAVYLLPKDIYNFLAHRKVKGLARSIPAQSFASFEGFSLAADANVGINPSTSFGDISETPMSPISPAGYPPIQDKTWGRHGQYTREFAAFGWIVFLIAACWFFGFVWGVPAFMAAYGLTCTHRFLRSWFQRLMFSVFSAAVMWAITYEMLNLIHLTFTPKINF